ncbi:MAG: RES family NAD+ phosphorylase [Rhodopseudomonas palustris]|uniref:RES family NAD+ phosphorylase n=1 Tax=Rhodopseudomonas palustris TaxID=1076 RepID=A0A933S1X1_RHOPL|nr:RES family NAD+ phosphorylase [Rhodopseudomonas palustris]
MELWRISNYADLSGIGGIRANGRWHWQGRQIVYLADHPASALLEMLVHLDRDLLPSSFQLLRIAVPDTIAIESVEEDTLPSAWRTRVGLTRQIGDRWLDRGSSALLRVPSVIVPHARNYLLNPAHRDGSAITVAEIIKAPFDPRLLAT